MDNNNESNSLERTAEAIGADFTVNIVDGVMHLTPAEAGVALFAFVEMVEKGYADYEENISRLADELMEKADDNARLRNLVEELIPTLESLGYADLVEEILKVCYPVRGIAADGEKWVGNDSVAE
jgi:hypothetical protein